jgi:hypothetical protein
MIRVRLELNLDDEDLDQLAQRMAERVEHPTTVVQAWLDVAGAAAHLGLTVNAIRGLVKRRQIPVHRTENGRLRFAVTELDQWVRSGTCELTTADLP